MINEVKQQTANNTQFHMCRKNFHHENFYFLCSSWLFMVFSIEWEKFFLCFLGTVLFFGFGHIYVWFLFINKKLWRIWNYFANPCNNFHRSEQFLKHHKSKSFKLIWVVMWSQSKWNWKSMRFYNQLKICFINFILLHSKMKYF